MLDLPCPLPTLSHCAVWQALEALRKLRTEKVQETKELKLKLEHLRTHKENADELRKVCLGARYAPAWPLDACTASQQCLQTVWQLSTLHTALHAGCGLVDRSAWQYCIAVTYE